MLRGRGSITGLRPSPGHGADPPSPGALSGRRRPDTGSSRGDLERTHRLANSSRTKGTQGLLGRGSGRRGVGGTEQRVRPSTNDGGPGVPSMFIPMHPSGPRCRDPPGGLGWLEVRGVQRESPASGAAQAAGSSRVLPERLPADAGSRLGTLYPGTRQARAAGVGGRGEGWAAAPGTQGRHREGGRLGGAKRARGAQEGG